MFFLPVHCVKLWRHILDTAVHDHESFLSYFVGPMSWVHRQMVTGVDPRVVLQRLVPDCSSIPDSIDDISLWKLVLQIISEPPRRKKLKDVNSLSDVVHLIQTCKKIMVLTGAGVSTSFVLFIRRMFILTAFALSSSGVCFMRYP